MTSQNLTRWEPVLEDDDALEALWKRQYSLTAITAPDQFKSYDDLEKRLKYVSWQVNRYIPDEELESESVTKVLMLQKK